MELKGQLSGRHAAIERERERRRLSVKVAKRTMERRKEGRKDGSHGTFQNHDFDDKASDEDGRMRTDTRRWRSPSDSAAVGNHL